MFKTFQTVFGSKFWSRSIIDVSHHCDARSKKKVEAWLEKLAHKFPGAADVLDSKVFVDAPEMEHDTLEELYRLCKSKQEFSPLEIERIDKNPTHSSLEDISHSSDCISEDRLRLHPEDSLEFDHSRPQSRTSFNNSYDCSRPSSRSSMMYLEVPKPISRSDMNLHRPVSRSDLHLPLTSMPPLPPRSPTLPSRRRTLPSPTYGSCRSLTSTPRLPRAFMPSFSPTDEFSLSPALSRLSRRSLRETSPLGLSSRPYSRETSPLSFSRESSPSPTNRPSYPTIGLPTYLRTSFAHKFPFTRAMRSGRLVTKVAVEEEIELQFCSVNIPPLPALEHARVSRSSLEDDLVLVPAEVTRSERPGQVEHFTPRQPDLARAASSMELYRHQSAASEQVNILKSDVITELEVFRVDKFKAKRTSEPKIELELFKPESLLAKNPFTLIKKALLPKIKYHWDQGFSQGPNGWQKVPIIKLKLKYNEEDQELLPPSVSVEGGRYCENRRVKLDGGRAKLKLKTAEVVDVQLRGVPLDKDGRQESWIPEFLFTVHKADLDQRKEGEKWKKAVVTPAMPE